MKKFEVHKLEKLQVGQVDDINRLILQLNSKYKRALSFAELSAVIQSPTNTVFIATAKEGVVGVIILSTHSILIGAHTYIENLIVDLNWRGKGIARQLVQAVIDEANARGIHSIKLSTGEANEAANALYKSFGFKRWGVNTYALEFTPQP